MMKAKIPVCKCGNPCQYYGGHAGYSVACKKCNGKNAKRQRDARKRKKPTSSGTISMSIMCVEHDGLKASFTDKDQRVLVNHLLLRLENHSNVIRTLSNAINLIAKD